MSTNPILSKHEDVVEFATKVGKDIGGVANLQTTDKTSVVAAINELTNGVNTAFSDLENAIDNSYAKKSDLTSLATKSDLSKQITDLIGGADADNDTLKEIADRVTALAQADKGLVSVTSKQAFNEAQKQQARDNIGAISEANVNGILEAQSGGDYVSAYLQASK